MTGFPRKNRAIVQKRHRRRRGRWLLLACAAACVATTVLSVWTIFGITLAPVLTEVSVCQGRLWVNHDLYPPARWSASIHWYSEAPVEHWWRPRIYVGREYWIVAIPMWIPNALLIGGSVWVWWPRRAVANLCEQCGYDRTGLPRIERCPECGSSDRT
jgi:hypothetical protein